MCCLALCVCIDCWYSVFNLVLCVYCGVAVCLCVVYCDGVVYCVVLLLYGVVFVLRGVCIVRFVVCD